MVKKRVTKFRERTKSTLPIKVMVFQITFEDMLAHLYASCVKPLIARSTKNGVLVASDGLQTFAAGKLYTSPGRARIGMDITRELV